MGEVRVKGLHHITLVTANIDAMVEFLVQIVGIHLLKTTVNYDAHDQKHYYLGDERGSPGSIITFFEIPHLSKSQVGVGSMHHLAFCVEDSSDLENQMKRLEENGISHSGILDRTYFKSLYFRGPENLLLEFATTGPGFCADGPQKEGKNPVIIE